MKVVKNNVITIPCPECGKHIPPSITEKQINHIFHLSRYDYASSGDMIIGLKKEGYNIISVKEEGPVIVHNVLKYNGEYYLKRKAENCL